MGPEYWKPGSPTALKKCSERVSNSCTDETDGCCAVIPCSYCLEWDAEGSYTTEYGTADFATNNWTGTVVGVTWTAYWERNYDTDECEFVVLFDGEEVYRKSCYEGQSCRDSSDSVAVSLQYLTGVLTWQKFLARPLEYIDDEDTNCKIHFCDECECSTECLCVTITEPDTTTSAGEICDTAYACDPPLWEGTVGELELSVALGRDEYNRCIITATVDGIEQEPVLFPGCGDATATVTLYDGTTILLSAKKCDCSPDSLCCGGRDLSGTLYLRMVYPSTSTMVDCGDTLVALTDNGNGTWTGNTTASIEIPDAGGEACAPMQVFFEFYCDPAGPVHEIRWRVEYLGTEYPTAGSGAELRDDGKYWCGWIRVSEDCEYPFLEVWTENELCVHFWNSYFTLMVSEVPI